jgi:hypothetical protein
MLVLLACCDKSTIVALEAIKGLAGASYPAAAATAAAGSHRPPLLPDEHAEADARVRANMGWQLLLAHATDEAPQARQAVAAAPAAAGPTGSSLSTTMARCATLLSSLSQHAHAPSAASHCAARVFDAEARASTVCAACGVLSRAGSSAQRRRRLACGHSRPPWPRPTAALQQQQAARAARSRVRQQAAGHA